MSPLLQLVYILIVGTICQVAGWRLRVPSILLLLLAGILSGPVFEVLSPDQVLGPILMPFVELSVAVILFEGGLSLKEAEFGSVGNLVSRLVSLGVLVTWVLLGLSAYFLLDLSGPVSALLGAILVVTGPTVIIPLLRSIRARPPVEPVLRWEGILIDPIGVVLAVLVAEVFGSGIGYATPWRMVIGMFISLSVGGALGWIGYKILRTTVGRHIVPDQFIVPLSLSVLFGLVILSNALHEQSGLLTATIMGLFVGWARKPWVQTIEVFIGHSQRIFLGVLFIILAARLDPHYVSHLNPSLILFIGTAIVIVRPIAVFLSTFGTKLTWREQLAIASLAPRGIVSAALASSLSVPLLSLNIPGIETIVPYTFATIIGTVAFYGLVTPIIFGILKVRQSATEGVLFLGGGPVPVAFGRVLQQEGFRVAYVDTNPRNIRRTRAVGLRAYQGSIFSDIVQEDLDLDGIGNLIAFTTNDEANSLAAAEFRHLFGSGHVFQVALPQTEQSKVSGRIFGEEGLSIEKMEDLWSHGYRPVVRAVPEGDSESPSRQEGEYLFAEIEGDKLFIVSRDNLKRPTNPEKLILFVPAR